MTPALLIAVPAIASLAAGFALLFRWHPRGRRRLARRGLIVVLGVLTCYWVALPVAMAVIATNRPHHDVGTPSLGRPYAAVTLHSRDGVRLAAWYVPSRNRAAVISVPTRGGKLDHARMLVRHGYGVLLLDLRGYDASSGRTNVFGWGATKDIDAAVAWLRTRPDVDPGRIGGIGFSVGAEQMLEAAAENHGLRAVVSDGAGERSVREMLLRGPSAALALPEAAAQTLALAALSRTMPPPSLADVVPRIAPRAVLFVYAQHGGGGEDLTPRYFDAAHEPKVLWRVPGAHHTGGLDALPKEYEQRVVGFFDRYLLA